MKIELQIDARKIKKQIDSELRSRGFTHMNLKSCLPFFKPTMGKFIHRVKSGRVHFRHGIASHTSLDYWCGNIGFLHKGELISESNITCKSCIAALNKIAVK